MQSAHDKNDIKWNKSGMCTMYVVHSKCFSTCKIMNKSLSVFFSHLIMVNMEKRVLDLEHHADRFDAVDDS